MQPAHRDWWDRSWRTVKPTTLDEVHSFWVSTDKVKYGYVRALLREGGAALEVGCGTATISLWLQQDTPMRIHVLDESLEALRLTALRLANESSHRGVAVRGDAFRLPYRDGSFDLVQSYGLLEHFSDMNAAVREMVRVLGPGGVFFADIAPRKFSFDLVFDVLFLPPYILLLWMRHMVTAKAAHREELVRRIAEWKYLFAFFLETESTPNPIAAGGFEARLDWRRFELFLRDECGLRAVKTTGSMLLPSNLYRVFWKLSPRLHQWLQRLTENKRWTLPFTSGIWVSGVKPEGSASAHGDVRASA